MIIKVDGHFLVGPDVPYHKPSTLAPIERTLEACANAIGPRFFGWKESEKDAERCEEVSIFSPLENL